MNMRYWVIWVGVAGGCLCGGCAHHVQRSPALVQKENQPADSGGENFLEKAGATTVDVVTAPVRLLAPGKKPPKEPEVWAPAEMTIVGPGVEEAEGAPAATRPATTQAAGK